MSKGTATVTRSGPAPRPESERVSRTKIIVGSVAAGFALFFAGVIGYSIGSPAHQDVSVNRTFTGKVTLVNGDGTAGCVTPVNGGAKVCASFATYQLGKLVTGQEVKAAVVLASRGNSSADQVLFLYPVQAG